MYLIALLIASISLGGIAQYAVNLSNFLQGHIITISHEEFKSDFWMAVIWGLGIFILTCGSRAWNGYWPHEKK